MHTLLSELYTADGDHAKAMAVHEEILWQVVNDTDDNDNDNTTVSAQGIKLHLDLLKRTHQRLGGWDKEPKIYSDLFHDVTTAYKGQEPLQDVHPIGKWPTKGADEKGVFFSPSTWNILEEEEGGPNHHHHSWLWRMSGVKGV
jgi:hypothetical protein